MFEEISLFLATLFVVYVVQSVVKPKNFPPGPRWYPFFGSSSKIYSLTKKHGSQFQAFLELSKEYSTKALGLKLGGELVVVFFGEKNVRAALNAEELLARPDNFFVRLRCFGKIAGITLADGLLWKIHRKFTLTHLRNAGFGKGPMEKDVQNTLQDLVECLTKQNAQPIWVKDFMVLPVFNVLWKCAAGEKVTEENFNNFKGLLRKRGKLFNLTGGLLSKAPWIRFILPEYSGYSMLLEVNKQISQIIEEAILKHKNKEVESDDFIYAFLQEVDKNSETFTEDQLKVVCIDLILAGAETSSNTMEFAILQVLRDLEIQKKIQQEIDLLLGDNVPCWNDSFRLIYTSAFLLELQRCYTVFPLAGPRRALKNIIVDGYLIPRNTTVLISLADIHMDPNLWEDPHVFKPERFIDEYGNLKKSEHLYTFGLGRRKCPGDALARLFSFITFTGLMQQFTITCADDHLPSNVPDIGIFASAKSFKAVFTPRKPERATAPKHR